MVTNKKGQIGNLTGLITVLIVVGILIGVGFLILEQFKSDLSDTVVTVSNETTRAVVTATGTYMAFNSTTSGVNCYNNFIVTSIYNQTGTSIALVPTNYSYDSNGKVYSITSGLYNNSFWNVSYTYQKGEDACNGVELTVTGLQKVPVFLPVIVIIAIVGILLAIVFGALKFTDRGSVAQT
jgi:hypothetical protein